MKLITGNMVSDGKVLRGRTNIFYKLRFFCFFRQDAKDICYYTRNKLLNNLNVCVHSPANLEII